MIDTEKLKAIDPEIILNVLGIPYKQVGARIMASATYREEQTPSISIQEKNGRWLWTDFGTGEGGSWIDLAMLVNNCDYVEAIKFLNNIENAEVNMDTREKKIFSFDRQEKKSNSVTITSISDVTDRALINYLNSRAISFMPDWLKQINYSVVKDNKTYLNSAVCIKNSAGGYAIRNIKIKMNIGKSAYSLFAKDSKKELVFVAEGMFDGLSIAEKMKNNRLYDLIILNSTNNLNSEVIKILSGYKNIILVLDNDVSGKEAQNEISRQVKNVNIHKLTFKAKDLNEAFVLKEKIGVAVCR